MTTTWNNRLAAAKKTVEVEIFLNGAEIADLFWQLDGDQQAIFFNVLAAKAQSKLPFQMQFVTDSKELNAFGRSAMDTIGNYARPSCPRVTGPRRSG